MPVMGRVAVAVMDVVDVVSVGDRFVSALGPVLMAFVFCMGHM